MNVQQEVIIEVTIVVLQEVTDLLLGLQQEATLQNQEVITLIEAVADLQAVEQEVAVAIDLLPKVITEEVAVAEVVVADLLQDLLVEGTK